METPSELGPRGQRLWASIVAADARAVDLNDARRDVAIEACRVGDQMDALAEILEREGLIVYDDEGRPTKPHPALSELNRIRPLQARLIVALRLPDPVTGARHRALPTAKQPTRPGGSALERVSRAKPAA